MLTPQQFLDSAEKAEIENDETKKGSVVEPRKFEIISASELIKKSFPPLRWMAAGVIPEGFTMLAGRPKSGKSIMALNLAQACTNPKAQFLGSYCRQIRVLYLALEDTTRRIKDRFLKMASIAPCDNHAEHLYFATTAPRMDEGFAPWLTEEIHNRKLDLVIIDTLAKVMQVNRNAGYEADYHATGQLHDIFRNTGCSIIVLTHTRKMEAVHALDSVNGTTGITGAADTILTLNTSGNNKKLTIQGRDVDERTIALKLDKELLMWIESDEPSELSEPGGRLLSLETKQQIVLLSTQGISQQEIARRLDISSGTVNRYVNLHKGL